MHRIRLIGRWVALGVVAAALLAAVTWFSGSASRQERAHADFDWADRYHVSCDDFYLDMAPLGEKGDPPGDEDILASKSLTRGEPSQTVLGAVDVTTVTYPGPDADGDTVADKPPSDPCGSKLIDGQWNPENNRLNQHVDYRMVSNKRPTATGQLVLKLAGDPPEPVTNLEYATCQVDESSGKWLATQVSIVLREKGDKAVNYGYGWIFTEATSPVGGDPWTCVPKTGELYVDMFPFVIESYTRDATTDHPELLKNADALLWGDLRIDPDGPNQPKPKDAKQLPDGPDELAAGPFDSDGILVDYLADDWDGDGCPDWDELDPNSHASPDLPNGLDPFNPHDCNQAVNIGGIYRARAVAVPATKDDVSNEPIPGAYYHCIADVQQDGNDLETRLYCYIDIPGVPVNPENTGSQSGDGFEGVPPPPPYGDMDDIHTVLTGTHEKDTNTVEMSGCFEDRDGQGALGNVYVESVQDAHSGKGTVSIWVLQTTEDCLAGTPVGDPTVAELHSVKVAEKGPCDKEGPRCLAGGEHDFDGDGCPDKAELSDDEGQGGLRDPYNPWDYFNPTLDGQNRVDDILMVVSQYFIDQGYPGYTKKTDRSALVGSNQWNFGPPNGQQRVDDILAAVKSYFHDCGGGKIVDPDTGGPGPTPAPPPTPSPDLDFSMSVEAAGCDTAGGSTKCDIPWNSDFTVSVSLDDVSGIGNQAYDAAAVTIAYSGDVTSNGSLTMNTVWPDCVFPAPASGPGFENVGCTVFVGLPSSTYTGEMATGSFHCGDLGGTGTLSLIHSAKDTLVIDSKSAVRIEAGPDVLAVNCLLPPKHGIDGSLTGVYDIQVHLGGKTVTLYHCIARTDHDAGSDDVKSAAQCYADVDISDPNSAIPNLPGEGPDIDGDTVLEYDGPPPPPPYTEAAPTKFNGSYDPGTDSMTMTGCFADVGGTMGPNIIARVVVTNAKAQLAANGKQTGSLYLYPNQSIAQCDAKVPSGPEPDPLPINLHRVGDGNPAPWRTPGDDDWDDDGCTDWQELDKTDGRYKCGDDPFNPYDGPAHADDVSGTYTMTVILARADWDKDGDELIPGIYGNSLFVLQQGPGKQLTSRGYTYRDTPLLPVNPGAMEPGQDCVSNPEKCGDGLRGAAPPPPFGDVDDKHFEFTGSINNDDNTTEVEGCAEDRDGQDPNGYVYVRVRIDLHTGQGEEEVWTHADPVDCTGDGSAFVPGTGEILPVRVARQSDGIVERDTDGDRCPDKNELSDDQTAGGLRDPFNRWDYFNPTLDGQNRVDDILAVVNQYFIDKGNPGYTKHTDRTSVIGANPWNLGLPNGEQRVDDILHAVNSYFHDCSGGVFVDPDDEKGH